MAQPTTRTVHIAIRADADTTNQPDQVQALLHQLLTSTFVQGYLRSKGVALKALSVFVTPESP